MVEFKDSYRLATAVLVTRESEILGQLSGLKLSVPWLQEVSELVDVARAQHGINLTVLRLLEVDDSRLPQIDVSYLCEIDADSIAGLNLNEWEGLLDEQALRLPYAKPGGPARELSWANERLERAGLGSIQVQTQIRTWNLSSIWQLETNRETYWLKSIPGFFAHEGSVLALFADEAVPQLVDSDRHRILLHHIPGEDCYGADLRQMMHMIDVLVDLQYRWQDRHAELLGAGLPDHRGDYLTRSIPAVVAGYSDQLDSSEVNRLSEFSESLEDRFSQLDDCGLPDTLVHGDYHPGNWRGSDTDLKILDWGDCCIGHPLLDTPALLERAGPHEEVLAGHWQARWQEKMPDADLDRAGELIKPIATAWKALIYDNFLVNIEPSERIFHEADPATYLKKTAAILAAGNSGKAS